MAPHAAYTAVLALLIAGATSSEAQVRGNRPEKLDLLRLLMEKPWIGLGPHNRWDRAPRIDLELGTTDLETRAQQLDHDEDTLRSYDDDIRAGSEKRSAVATALNAGRRRRQPAPALGVLNDMGTFFDALRDNLQTLALLSPEERSTLFQEPPTVVHAPSAGGGGGGGGGSGMRKLHALRPLRPTGNIRSYNRRSFVEADGLYPGANHHDPGLLWTGLGR